MHYLREELYQNTDTPLEFDIFATEGGTAAMTYIFQSAKNKMGCLMLMTK